MLCFLPVWSPAGILCTKILVCALLMSKPFQTSLVRPFLLVLSTIVLILSFYVLTLCLHAALLNSDRILHQSSEHRILHVIRRDASKSLSLCLVLSLS